MHEGLTLTMPDAIDCHAGQAAPVAQRFKGLSAAEQEQLLQFSNAL